MPLPLIDVLRARFDNFMNRLGFRPAVSAVKGYHQQPLQNAQPKKHAIPLFGSDPEDPFGFGYSAIRSTQPQGPGSLPLQSELKVVDADANLEDWKPNPDIPSLISHGKKLDYSHAGDQKPTSVGHDISPLDKEITLNSVEARKDFQSARGKSEPTIGDLHAIDLKKHYSYDFST